MATKQNTQILYQFNNDETNMAGIVAKIDRGFSAVLRDLDSGEYLPEAFIYSTQEQAISKARQLAGVN